MVELLEPLAPEKGATYTITFDANGGTPVPSSPVTLKYGSTISQPSAMTKTGYTFDKWYMDSAKTISAVFPITVTGNVSLYAKWNPISYTVLYNKNAADATGTTATSSHFYDAHKNLTTNGYSYTGYTFAGWAKEEGGTVKFTDGESVVNLTTENNSTITLYARWGNQPYYVEYNKNADEVMGTMTPSKFFFGVKQDLEENSFTRTGYTFAGWAKTSSGSMEFLDKQAVLDLAVSSGATVTLYAKWTAHTLAINYASGGGTGSEPTNPTSMAYGNNITMPANPYTRTGYTFACWEVSGTGSITGTHNAGTSVAVKDLSTAVANGNASITLTAKWTANTLTISYVNGGGTGSEPTSPTSAAYGTNVTMPANTYTRTGYTFTGWEVSGTGSISGTHNAGESVAVSALSTVIANGNASITLTALWTANTLTINYASGGGTGSVPTSPISAIYGNNVTMPANPYTRTGYTFAGWAVSGTNSVSGTHLAGASLAVTALSTGINNGGASITLTATWTVHTLSISYANGGGTGSAPTTPTSATYGNNVTMPANTYTKTGYTFAGWEVSGTGSVYGTYAAGTNVAVTALSTDINTGNASITLTAKWNIIKHTVTYYPDGGVPAPTSPVNADYGYTISQPSDMTKTGYTFDKWYTDSNKTTAAVFPITVTGDVNLYAKWTANTLSISYDSDGGTGSAPSSPTSATYGNSVNMPTNSYTRTGYTFAGWAVSGTGSVSGTYAVGTSKAVSDLSTNINTDNASITLTATWTANTLAIGYANGGGTGTAPTSPTSAAYGTNVTMPANTFNRTGYTFAGWEVSGTGSVAGTYNAGTIVAVTALSTGISNGNASIRLTATWTVNVYTVTFDKNNNDSGGTEANPQTRTITYPTTTITLPTAPRRTGYTFDGWNTQANGGGTPFTATTRVSEDITVYAQWIIAFTSVNAFQTWLNNKPANVADPYVVALNTNDLTGISTALKNNYTKYVYLDLSGSNITTIPDSSFKSCDNLTSIIIPNSVNSIGNYAFEYCNNLTSVTIPNSVTSIGNYAFDLCFTLTSVTIPDSVTSIGNYAFEYCNNLASVTIPNSVTSIGRSAFENCKKLTEINVDSGNTAYSSQDGVLYNKNKTTLVAYPAGKIGSSFAIPNSVTSIEGYAFRHCTNLTDVIIPNSVTIIGEWSFYGCTNLTSIIIPNTVTSIGDTSFAHSGLNSITIPNSVTSIGFQPFSNCSNLTEINVDSNNTAYSSQDGVLYNKNKTSLVAYPAGKIGGSFTIPNSVTSIDDIAFRYCTNLTSVIIPNSVTKIGVSAFNDCTNLTRVTFQGTIPSSGFYNNSTTNPVFLGDLRNKFYATNTTNGTPGTYTTTAPVSDSSVWTKN